MAHQTWRFPVLKDRLQRLSELKVLVVGDLMVDRYLWGEVERISPEAPVPVVKLEREEARLGGAANVAHNLTALGCQVSLAGLAGDDAAGLALREMLSELSVSHQGVLTDSSRPTTEKTRVMSQNRQLLRLDREESHPPSSAVADAVHDFLRREAAGCDGVIVSDYGKGLVGADLMAVLAEACRGAGISIVVDPKGMDYAKYAGAQCVTPNEREAGHAARLPVDSEQEVLAAARSLIETLRLPSLCITRGAQGVLALDGRSHRFLPTRAREVFDVSGAGDTFIATFGAMLFSGSPFFDAVAAANEAAGVSVGKLGTATVTRSEILAASETPPRFYSAAEIEPVAASLRDAGRRIVFTNGCFDLLHAGHVQYLQASRALGDVLIVGLNSDASVTRLKGPGRPLIGEEDRAHLIGALACVDYVALFDEDDPLELIRKVRPHLLTKGADYTVERVVGHDLVPQWGGEVRLIPLTEDRSTSGLIEKIAKRKG
ncbi:MAG: D-glycero-beta-D-manno-heptose-7-phosphate kinase [bacterium]